MYLKYEFEGILTRGTDDVMIISKVCILFPH